MLLQACPRQTRTQSHSSHQVCRDCRFDQAEGYDPARVHQEPEASRVRNPTIEDKIERTTSGFALVIKLKRTSAADISRAKRYSAFVRGRLRCIEIAGHNDGPTADGQSDRRSGSSCLLQTSTPDRNASAWIFTTIGIQRVSGGVMEPSPAPILP